MCSVFDIARYILDTVGEISTMKLQKLCYYAQAWHLARKGTPLFSEDFQAWANGPVCQPLFEVHKGLFSIQSKDIPNSKVKGDLTQENIKHINIIIDNFGEYMGAQLSEMTHREKPWIDARGDVPFGVNCSKVISKDSMKMFYASMDNGKK